MGTTTVRIAAPMKSRIARASKQTGLTAHALILDAVERRLEELEIDAEFHKLGEKRWAEFLKTGRSVPLEEGMAYLEALARGEKPKKPRARRLTR
jgi:predicted transcriptional regulator